MNDFTTPVVIAADTYDCVRLRPRRLFWTGETWSEEYADAHQYRNIGAAQRDAKKNFAPQDTFALFSFGESDMHTLPLDW